MLPPNLTFGPVTVRTYTFLLALAILVSAGIAIRRWRSSQPAAMVLDVYLGGLVGGVIVARLIHVLLNWNYFAYNLPEAIQIAAGGLDWRGAALGALVGMMLVARWQQMTLSPPLDALTTGIPLIAFAGWWGCWSASCAYGAEVATLADYPALLVWEGPDVFGIYAPRFNPQLAGMIGSALLFLIGSALVWRHWLYRVRVWIILMLLGAMMFALGFMRGDYALTLGALRLDQWLDLGMIVFAIGMTIRQLTIRTPRQRQSVPASLYLQ